MDWEVINGITGIVSAIGAIASIGYLGTHQKNINEESNSILTLHKFMAFLLACSGWVLCCLSFLWVIEPYGGFPLDREYQHFFGVMLAFPAIIIFIFGLKVMQGEKSLND